MRRAKDQSSASGHRNQRHCTATRSMPSVASIAVVVAVAVVTWGVVRWSESWAAVSCLTVLGCALLGVAECRLGLLACGLELGGPPQVGEGRAALPELDERLPG
jgi:hypothetical protein